MIVIDASALVELLVGGTNLTSPLVTCDGRLAAAPGNRAHVELFA